MRNLLEEKCSTRGFDGTLGIDDVNAKPLIAILHWMYCEELSKDTGRFMEEVILASEIFQLKELLETLDKKMILFCELGNMLELFRVAQKQSMKTAMKDISAFVKRYVIFEVNLIFTSCSKLLSIVIFLMFFISQKY